MWQGCCQWVFGGESGAGRGDSGIAVFQERKWGCQKELLLYLAAISQFSFKELKPEAPWPLLSTDIGFSGGLDLGLSECSEEQGSNFTPKKDLVPIYKKQNLYLLARLKWKFALKKITISFVLQDRWFLPERDILLWFYGSFWEAVVLKCSSKWFLCLSKLRSEKISGEGWVSTSFLLLGKPNEWMGTACAALWRDKWRIAGNMCGG